LRGLAAGGADSQGADQTQAELLAVRSQLQAREADVAALQAQVQQAQSTAQNAGPSDAEEQLARLRLQLKAAQARTSEAGDETGKLRSDLARLQQSLDQAEAARLAARAEWQAAVQAHEVDKAELAGLQQAGGAQAELEAHVARLTATNRELEASAGANLKRIQKLMKDMDEARNQLANAGGGGAGQAEVAQLQAEIATLRAEKALVEQRLHDAEGKAVPVGGPGAASPQMSKLLGELNGVVSSFRNDFMTVSDAYEQIRSEDTEERDEGFDMLREGIDACTTRSGELKNIIRDLKAALGEA
jgi:chromosome segregation ATPase